MNHFSSIDTFYTLITAMFISTLSFEIGISILYIPHICFKRYRSNLNTLPRGWMVAGFVLLAVAWNTCQNKSFRNEGTLYHVSCGCWRAHRVCANQEREFYAHNGDMKTDIERYAGLLAARPLWLKFGSDGTLRYTHESPHEILGQVVGVAE